MPREYKMAPASCEWCGVKFKARISDLKRGRGRFCGLSCAGKNRAAFGLMPTYSGCQSGPNNGNWKGGRAFHKKGYVYIHAPDHPRASAGPGDLYVFEHILVAEQMLNRPLTPDEVVHHKNKKKWDNRPENIAVFASAGDHTRHHFGQQVKAVIGL